MLFLILRFAFRLSGPKLLLAGLGCVAVSLAFAKIIFDNV